jgi:hypothetical protein
MLRRSSVFEYIEAFYNGVRRHSTVHYQSPSDFERGLSKSGCLAGSVHQTGSIPERFYMWSLAHVIARAMQLGLMSACITRSAPSASVSNHRDTQHWRRQPQHGVRRAPGSYGMPAAHG